MKKVLKKLAIKLILLYQQKISTKSTGKCKFYPTCSNYALEAIEKFGIIKGTFISVLRLLRCNEFSSGGIDNVPKNKKNNKL